MSSIANVIAISRERPVYPQSLSRWFAKTAGRPLRLVLSFYSPDGNEVAMPLASISAYLKRDFPWVELHLCPILILRDERPLGNAVATAATLIFPLSGSPCSAPSASTA